MFSCIREVAALAKSAVDHEKLSNDRSEPLVKWLLPSHYTTQIYIVYTIMIVLITVA